MHKESNVQRSILPQRENKRKLQPGIEDGDEDDSKRRRNGNLRLAKREYHPILQKRCKVLKSKVKFLPPAKIARLAGLQGGCSAFQPPGKNGLCMIAAFNGECVKHCMFKHAPLEDLDAKFILGKAEAGLQEFEKQAQLK